MANFVEQKKLMFAPFLFASLLMLAASKFEKLFGGRAEDQKLLHVERNASNNAEEHPIPRNFRVFFDFLL